MHPIISVRWKVGVLTYLALFLIFWTNGEDPGNCGFKRNADSFSQLKKLVYSTGSTNPSQISYSVLELLEIVQNNTEQNAVTSENIGMLVLLSSNNNAFGVWQFSAENNQSASPQWHNFNLPENHSSFISKISRSSISLVNLSSLSFDEVGSIPGIVLPLDHHVRFIPNKPFWSTFEGIGETSLVFSAMKLNDLELREDVNSATRVTVDIKNLQSNLFVLRADWTDCSNEPILTSPKEVDACGICGGDGSTCIDCFGMKNGDAIFRCGKCIPYETELSQKECQKKISIILEGRFKSSEREIKNPTKIEIVGASSPEYLCDGHTVEVFLNDDANGFSNLTERSGHPFYNWTLDFEMKHGPPRSQADVLKIWDTIRHLQQNLNNQTHPGIIPRFIINSSMLSEGVVYRAKLNSRVGRTKSGYHQGVFYEFKLSRHPDPTNFRIEILGPSKLHTDIEGYYEVRIVTCDNDKQNKAQREFQVSWSINGTQGLGVSSQQNGVELKILRNYLKPGHTYNLTAFVRDIANHEFRLVSASKIINVHWRKSDEDDYSTAIFAHTSQTVELNSDVSTHFDTSEMSGLEVHWRCRTLEQLPCAKSGSESTIEDYLGFHLFSKSILRFPTSALAPATYTWTALIFNGPRHCTYSSSLTVHNASISTKVPDFKIISIEDSQGALKNRKVGPSGLIKATARVDTKDFVSTNAIFRWDVKVRSESNKESLQVDFDEKTKEISEQSEESTITIANLIPGAKYFIKLNFLENDVPIAYEQIQVATGKIPSRGHFTVEPMNGVALRTEFVFKIHSWVSENGDDSLQYEVGYTTPEWLEGIADTDVESVTQWLQGHNSELTYVTDNFPTGGAISGKIIPMLRICDSLACTLIEHDPINVTVPEDGFSDEDISQISRVMHEKLNLREMSEVLSYSYSVLRSFELFKDPSWQSVLNVVQNAVVKLNSTMNFRATELDRIFNLIEKMLWTLESKELTQELSKSLMDLRTRIRISAERSCNAEALENTVRQVRETKNEKSDSQIIKKPTTPKPMLPLEFEFEVTSAHVLLQTNSKQNVTKLNSTKEDIGHAEDNVDATKNTTRGVETPGNSTAETKGTENSGNSTKVEIKGTDAAGNASKETKGSEIPGNSTTTEIKATETSGNSTKGNSKPNATHKIEEVREMLIVAEKLIINANSTEIGSGIREIHNTAELLCNYIYNLGKDEDTISGNLTKVKVKVAKMEDKTMESNTTEDSITLTAEEFKNEGLKIIYRKAFKINCSEAEGSECTFCYGIIYFEDDILACSGNKNNTNPIWEAIIIGTTNNSAENAKNLTKFHSSVNLELKIDKPSTSNTTFKCAGWNTEIKAWDTNLCENATMKTNSTVVQCECKELGFYRLVSIDQSNDTEIRNISKRRTELEQKLGVWFRFNGDYNETVAKNKTSFENHVWVEIEEQFLESKQVLYEIKNVTVRPERAQNVTDSIIVNLFLELNPNVTDANSTEGFENIVSKLENALLNESLVLTDLNNKRIVIPSQNLIRNALIRAEPDNGIAGWVILGVIICVGLFAIVVVVRKHKKEREDSVRPMRTEQYNLHGEPIPPSAIKPVRHVDVDSPDEILNNSCSVTTMSTSFNSLPNFSPGSEIQSSKIQWHANQGNTTTGGSAKIYNNLSESSSPSPIRGTSAASDTRMVIFSRDQNSVSTNPMAPVDHSISSFPNSTMY